MCEHSENQYTEQIREINESLRELAAEIRALRKTSQRSGESTTREITRALSVAPRRYGDRADH